MAESEELKSLLMTVKEESEKVVLKHNILGLRSWPPVQSHHFMANRWGNNGNSEILYFGGAPKSLQMVSAAMKLKDTPWKKSYDQPRPHIKKQKYYFTNKVHLVKAMVFQ